MMHNVHSGAALRHLNNVTRGYVFLVQAYTMPREVGVSDKFHRSRQWWHGVERPFEGLTWIIDFEKV